MITMRQRFYQVAAELLEEDPRVAVVLAEIGAGELRPHPRLFNVGIREQLMVAVAAGLALEGLRPIVHSYAPFLVERPFEQVKLDLVHQGVGAVLVSTGASYDGARSGRTHQAPEDVALLRALPGWTIHVPGHPDEVDRFVRRAAAGDDNVYVRLSEEVNSLAVEGDGLVVVRSGRAEAPLVVAVGPTLDQVLAATVDLDASVAYVVDRPSLRLGGAPGGGARHRRRPRRALSRRYLRRGGRGRPRRPSPPPARPRCCQRRDPPLRRRPGAPSPARPRRGRDPAVDRGVPG